MNAIFNSKKYSEDEIDHFTSTVYDVIVATAEKCNLIKDPENSNSHVITIRNLGVMLIVGWRDKII